MLPAGPGKPGMQPTMNGNIRKNGCLEAHFPICARIIAVSLPSEAIALLFLCANYA